MISHFRRKKTKLPPNKRFPEVPLRGVIFHGKGFGRSRFFFHGKKALADLRNVVRIFQVHLPALAFRDLQTPGQVALNSPVGPWGMLVGSLIPWEGSPVGKPR